MPSESWKIVQCNGRINYWDHSRAELTGMKPVFLDLHGLTFH